MAELDKKNGAQKQNEQKVAGTPTGPMESHTNDQPPRQKAAPQQNYQLAHLLNKAETPTGFSPAAKSFIDDLTARIASSNRGMGVYLYTASNFETAIVHNSTGHSCVLIFAETYTGPSNVPESVWALDVSEQLKRHGVLLPGGKPIDSVQEWVVKPEDYPRVDIFNVALSNLLIGSIDAKEMNVQFLKNTKINVETDLDRVMSFIDRHYPLAVKPRADVGVLLSVVSPDTVSYDQQLIGAGGRRNENPAKELLAITGFTEFIAIPVAQLPQNDATTQALHKAGATHKFAPVFRVTNIVSPLVTPGMLIMGLAFAADMFLNRNFWTQAYSLRPGQPNIGNLINDKNNKGKPWVAKSIQERDQFLRIYATGTYMSLDALRGTPRIPGIETLAGVENEASRANMIQHIRNFFTEPVPNKISVEDQKTLQEYHSGLDHYLYQCREIIADQWPLWVGSCSFAEQTVDTRYVDYLNIAAKTGNTENLGHLLTKPSDPSEIARWVNELVSDAKFHFIGYQGLLRPDLIRLLVDYFSAHLDVNLPQSMPLTDHTIQTLASNNYSITPSGSGFHPVIGHGQGGQGYYGSGYNQFF